MKNAIFLLLAKKCDDTMDVRKRISICRNRIMALYKYGQSNGFTIEQGDAFFDIVRRFNRMIHLYEEDYLNYAGGDVKEINKHFDECALYYLRNLGPLTHDKNIRISLEATKDRFKFIGNRFLMWDKKKKSDFVFQDLKSDVLEDISIYEKIYQDDIQIPETDPNFEELP